MAAKTQPPAFAAAGIRTSPLSPPAPTITEPTNDARLLAVKRFVFGNCVHCHNGSTVVDFRPESFVTNTVGKAVDAQSVVPPAGWKRVIPGNPDHSVLFVQVQRQPLPMPTGNDTKNRLRPMPPVGVSDVAADLKAVAD